MKLAKGMSLSPVEHMTAPFAITIGLNPVVYGANECETRT